MGQSLRKPVLATRRPNKEKDGRARQDNRIRLTDFIDKNEKQIVSEWESFARTLKPAANDMTPLALRDHIHEILLFIVGDIRSPQTQLQQAQKSQGKKKEKSTTSAAQTHAALRLAGGFNIDQMVSEWRALRASVIKLWCKANTQMNATDIIDLTRFNEAIDQEVAESVSHYTTKVGHSKNLFIGILGHDLLSPLNVISMSAQLMLNIGMPNERQTLNPRQTMLATQIYESTSRITEIVTTLLDVTRARFGYGLRVLRVPMDMGFITRQLVDETRVAHPTRRIVLKLSGDLRGKWDKARIGQVLSNLIGNAIEYSFQDSAIGITVKGTPNDVVLSVHNEGVPVPPEKMEILFEALTRAVSGEPGHPDGVHLGLGLYITKDIVTSHGGTIDVISSEEEGTTFTARFPRSVAEAA